MAGTSSCPPERNAIPGTAGGTVAYSTRSVASATSRASAWTEALFPDSAMFVFRIVPGQVHALREQLVVDAR